MVAHKDCDTYFSYRVGIRETVAILPIGNALSVVRVVPVVRDVPTGPGGAFRQPPGYRLWKKPVKLGAFEEFRGDRRVSVLRKCLVAC